MPPKELFPGVRRRVLIFFEDSDSSSDEEFTSEKVIVGPALQQILLRPLSHTLWATRTNSALATHIIDIWHTLHRREALRIALRLAAGLRDPAAYQAPTGGNASDLILYKVVEEQVRAITGGSIEELPVSYMTSALWWCYGGALEGRDLMGEMAIQALCRLDVFVTSAGQGEVVAGPSTHPPNVWGAIVVGSVTRQQLPLLGREREAGPWMRASRPHVRLLSGAFIDASRLLSAPAVVVDPRTLVGVHPNCNISCNARGAWLEVPAASSMELVALRPAGMEL